MRQLPLPLALPLALVLAAACSDSSSTTDTGTRDASTTTPDGTASDPDATTEGPDATPPGDDAGGGQPDAGPPAPTPEIKSGTRLRARFLETADGARQFLGWFDRDRNARCSFLVATDGSRRCLPEQEITGYNAFSDSACKEPIRIIPPTMCPGPLGTVVYSQDELGCDKATTVRAIDQVLTPRPMMIYVKDFDGTCKDAPLGAMDEVRIVGDPIAPAEFVSAEITEDPSPGRLARTHLVASDGAIQRVGWYDRAEMFGCETYRAIDGARRCLPSPGGYYPEGRVYFVDDMCMTPGAIGFDSDCDPSSNFVFSYTQDMCESVATAYARGPEVMPGYFGGVSNMCTDASMIIGTTGHVYAIGAQLDTTEFAALTPGTSTSGRVRAKLDVASDGTSMQRRAEWIDSMRNDESCRFEVAGDGMRRCLPEGLIETFFTDSSCMTEIAGTTTTSSCTPPHAYVTTYTYPSACEIRAHVRTLGPPVVPMGSLYKGSPGSCNEVFTSANAFYEIIGEVAPADFASATEITE